MRRLPEERIAGVFAGVDVAGGKDQTVAVEVNPAGEVRVLPEEEVAALRDNGAFTDLDLSEKCAACLQPFALHTPPGVMGTCPPDVQQEIKIDTDGAGAVSSPDAPAGVPQMPAIAPHLTQDAPEAPLAGTIRAEMLAAARASWQWTALEKMEALRLQLPQDSGAEVLEHFRALRDAIADDVAGVSADVLPLPEDNPPPSVTIKKQPVPNMRGTRPQWKAETLAALTEVMDALDVDASNAVYNEWGLLKEALGRLETFPEENVE